MSDREKLLELWEMLVRLGCPCGQTKPLCLHVHALNRAILDMPLDPTQAAA